MQHPGNQPKKKRRNTDKTNKGAEPRSSRLHKHSKLKERARSPLLVLFTLVVTFAVSNFVIYAANTYYNLDTGEIVVEEIQRVTQAIRATGGLIVGGAAGDDPTAGVAFEVAGTQNILFSTTGTITQQGTGDVTFNGKVGVGGPPSATYEFAVTDTGGVGADGIVAQFAGEVLGVDAVQPTAFVTKQQLDAATDAASAAGVTTLNTIEGDLTLQGDTDGMVVVTTSDDTLDTITLSLGDNTITNAKLVNDQIQVVPGAGITITGTDATDNVALGGSITISADTGNLSQTFFEQGGNSFGVPAILGTNDVFDLSLETGGVSRLTIGAAGGVTLATGNDFTVTDGTATFGGDIVLAGGVAGDRNITTQNNETLILAANGTGVTRIGDSAGGNTGNVEFFNSSNFIDSSGNLTIAGNFTMSGLSISSDGTLTTIASDAAEGLVIDSGTGQITLANTDDIFTDGGFNVTEGSVFRAVQPIFGFDVPVRCSTSCVTGTSAAVISRTIESYSFPTAYTGTTRRHNFTIRYADDMASPAVSTWDVVNSATDIVITTFTVPASPGTSLDAGTVYTTGDVAIPTDATDWHLEVSVPTGQTVQVYQVFLGAYDEINDPNE